MTVCDLVVLEIVRWHVRPFPRTASHRTVIWQHPYTKAETYKALAAGYRTRELLPEPVGVHQSVSRLEMPAPWLAELSANLEEVMNAESLELQAIFNSDHLVRFCVGCDFVRLEDLRSCPCLNQKVAEESHPGYQEAQPAGLHLTAADYSKVLM